jgi:ABC-type branched-subunit amino acid transport system substrate-binding protein
MGRGIQKTVQDLNQPFIPAVAYDTVYLLKAAIENIDGEVTRDAIRQNLQDLEGFVGLTGPNRV